MSNKWDFTKSYVTLPKEFSDCIGLKGLAPVEEIHQMIGFCSTLMAGNNVFDEQQALGVANEFCLLWRKYASLQAKLEVAKIALEFYAKGGHYYGRECAEFGNAAEEALQKLKE